MNICSKKKRTVSILCLRQRRVTRRKRSEKERERERAGRTFCGNPDQLCFRIDKGQRLVEIFDSMDVHFGAFVITEGFVANNFQQLKQFYSISKVCGQTINLAAFFMKMGIDPFCEGLGGRIREIRKNVGGSEKHSP